MPERTPVDQLDAALDALLRARTAESAPPDVDRDVAVLVSIAERLRDLPRARFRARLKSDLERTAVMTVTQAVPAVRQTATVQLRVRNAPAAIEFYTRAFGARELMRFEAGGRIAHAEIEIGNSVVMLGEEAPDYGYPSPETLGGAAAGVHLYVDDADAWVARAAAAGAQVTMPVKDEFYGDRVGQIRDPFGYGWTLATRTEDLSVEEMYRRFDALMGQQGPPQPARAIVPAGFRTVTPYVVVQNAPGLIEFTRRVFRAEQTTRTTGQQGGVHAEVRIGDSMLMIGGGAPELAWRGEDWPGVFHVYVEDTDAVFQRALDAGATSIGEPRDMEYGERSGGVKDPFGNQWYIATAHGDRYVPEGLHDVNAFLHPLRAEPLIAFAKRAFGAEEVAKYATPDGVIHHALIKIGDAPIEMGEAHGPYQPMPARFYVFVPDVDAAYRRALDAGAASVMDPTDQAYGHRNAGVKDPFGNEWYVASVIDAR